MIICQNRAVVRIGIDNTIFLSLCTWLAGLDLKAVSDESYQEPDWILGTSIRAQALNPICAQFNSQWLSIGIMSKGGMFHTTANVGIVFKNEEIMNGAVTERLLKEGQPRSARKFHFWAPRHFQGLIDFSEGLQFWTHRCCDTGCATAAISQSLVSNFLSAMQRG